MREDGRTRALRDLACDDGIHEASVVDDGWPGITCSGRFPRARSPKVRLRR
jgi:hypothetical protein